MAYVIRLALSLPQLLRRFLNEARDCWCDFAGGPWCVADTRGEGSFQ
jgi:hypothetical protein